MYSSNRVFTLACTAVPVRRRKPLHTGLVAVEQADGIIDLAFSGIAPKA